MSIPNTRKLRRRPTHPGEMLLEDFMPEYDLTVAGLADAVRVSRQSINELLRGRQAVSPEMALRLSRLFGKLRGVLAQRAAGGGISGMPRRRSRMTSLESSRCASHNGGLRPTATGPRPRCKWSVSGHWSCAQDGTHHR